MLLPDGSEGFILATSTERPLRGAVLCKDGEWRYFMRAAIIDKNFYSYLLQESYRNNIEPLGKILPDIYNGNRYYITNEGFKTVSEVNRLWDEHTKIG